MSAKKSLAQKYPGFKNGTGTSDTVTLYGAPTFATGLSALTSVEAARFYFSEGAVIGGGGNVAWLIDATFSLTGKTTYSAGAAQNAQLSLYRNGTSGQLLMSAPKSLSGATTVSFYQAPIGQATTQATPNWVQMDCRAGDGSQQFYFLPGEWISLVLSYDFSVASLAYSATAFTATCVATFNTFSIMA